MYPHEQPDRPREIMAQAEAPPSDKNTSQSKHPLHGRELLGYMQHALGGGTIIGLTIATILLWFLFRPPGQPTSRYLGEILGTTAILLFSCSLVVTTRHPSLWKPKVVSSLTRMRKKDIPERKSRSTRTCSSSRSRKTSELVFEQGHSAAKDKH